MKTPDVWNELVRRNRPLAFGGLLFSAMSIISLLLIPLDGRTVTGINPWIKPLKFDLSVTIYLWTLAWLLYELREKFPRSVKVVSRGVLVCMVAEIICIKLQAVRGVASHFNTTTPFDGLIFGIMGQFILANTLLTAWATVLFWISTPPLERAYLWGIRLGFLVFILGSLVGVVMVTNNAHSVGVADGGAGLPLINWSVTGGDLRAAHFVGMHALQLFPLVGYLLYRSRNRLGGLSPSLLTVLFCLAYTVLSIAVFRGAMDGKPLVTRRDVSVGVTLKHQGNTAK